MLTPEPAELYFDWDGLTLAGTLHLPPGAGPHPAVLMAQGSGPADRDSGGYFEPIRHALLDRGVATYAFDKPGCGESSGDWHNYALDARTDQIVAALAVIRNHPAIASERVGLFGHSQGGWLVQKLAGREGELAFAIVSSAPSLSVEEQMLYECVQTIRSHGHNEQAIRDARALTGALHEAAVDGLNYEAVTEQLLLPASTQSWFATYPTIEDASDWRHAQLLISEHHDPESDLRNVQCPFLAVYGALDSLLPPWRGAKESGRALAASPSSDVTVVVFPGGDHRMQDPDSKNLVDGYTSLLGNWIAERTEES